MDVPTIMGYITPFSTEKVHETVSVLVSTIDKVPSSVFVT